MSVEYSHYRHTDLDFKALRSFDWALVDPEKAWNKKNQNGLFSVSGMWVTVTERAERDRAKQSISA